MSKPDTPMLGEAVLRARVEAPSGLLEGNTTCRIKVREVRPGTRYRYRLEVDTGNSDGWRRWWPYTEALRIVQVFNKNGYTTLAGNRHFRLTTRRDDE